MTSLTASACHHSRVRLRCFAAALVLSVSTVGTVPSEAAAAKAGKEKREKDPLEMHAREAFAAGNYKEALDVYTKLSIGLSSAIFPSPNRICKCPIIDLTSTTSTYTVELSL